MGNIGTSLVRRRHAYTSVDLPWAMDEVDEGSNFLRYLRGGGLRAFATSSGRALRNRRQTRFLMFSGVLAVVWTIFYFV